MELFTPGHRTDRTVGPYAESTYKTLDRVAGPFWDGARQLLQSWLDGVGDPDARRALTRRLQGPDDQFRAAHHELYVHEALRRSGWEVTIEPTLTVRGSRPDFLARRGRDEVVVEVVTWNSSREAAAAQQRAHRCRDLVNTYFHEDVVVFILELQAGPEPLPRQFRAAFERWLRAGPEPGTSLRASARDFVWQDNGWNVRLAPYPRPRGVGGSPLPTRMVIGGPVHSGFAEHASKIRRLLNDKTDKYGDPKRPFVIAVGIPLNDHDDWHVSSALYGPPTVMFDPATPHDSPVEWAPVSGGYFIDARADSRRHISAVWIVDNLQTTGPHHAGVMQPLVTGWARPRSRPSR